MSDHKIKNKESLLSHGDAGAKAQVLELTERVLQRLCLLYTSPSPRD